MGSGQQRPGGLLRRDELAATCGVHRMPRHGTVRRLKAFDFAVFGVGLSEGESRRHPG